MRIYIKQDKKRMFIPIPFCMLKAALSIVTMPIILKYIPEKERRFMEMIDFKELKKCIGMLKEYKGLKMVEVRDSEGNRVDITI